MKQIILYSTLLTAIICLPASATIINIPDDYLTIQQGIDASADGDTVLVQPGTYVENINFNGHNIVLGSLFLTTGDTSYIEQTVIDGDLSGSVVIFEIGEDSATMITGFTIQNGNTPSGGGISCKNHSNPIISSNKIIGNHAFQGGGIHCRVSSPIIKGNTIKGNSTSAEGGGIWCDYSNPTITKNIIRENSACCGAGVFCFEGTDLIIRNNIISGNSAFYYGGAINFFGSYSVVGNNTISENTGRLGGGIFLQNDCDVNVVNTIFWGDSASNNGDEIFILYGSLTITFCNIQGGWEGEGNIDVDPLFRDPDNGDFHLMSTACGDPYDSPCIDAGHPDILDSLLDCSWGLGTVHSDMGAYGGGDSVTVGIDYDEIPVPDEFSVSQNYPNPFNATTVIRYSLPERADVVIEIYDILGRRVETLVHAQQPAGYHQVVWDATNFPSGVYFARLEAAGLSKSVRMVLLK